MAGEPLLAHHVDDEDAVSLQARAHVPEYPEVVVARLEIPERREHR
jgi:hypothetical protein